jgi:hypothetical protein
MTTDTLAKKLIESKHAAATSHSHGHVAKATSDRGPHFTVEHGLEHVESPCSAYSMGHIATTFYSIQVTSYCNLVYGLPPIAMHKGSNHGSPWPNIVWMGTRMQRHCTMLPMVA